MWWEETRMGRPERIEITGPAGEATHALWVFDLFQKNSSGEDRSLAVSEVAVVLGLKGPLGATRPIKVVDDIEVTVRLVDDGNSTVYKAAAFRAASRAARPTRFPDGTLEKDREITVPVVFEEEDVDWEDVYRQVAEAITPSSSALYQAVFAGAARREDVLKLREARETPLPDTLKTQIRKEVLEQIPGALQEAFENRRFTLELKGRSDIAIGNYRVTRDFTRRTVIDSSLIKKWGR